MATRLTLPGQKASDEPPSSPPSFSTLQTLSSVVAITSETYKSVRTGICSIDQIIGPFEEGITILYGAPDTGKTNLLIHLLFNALEGKYIENPYSVVVHPLSVKYLDVEMKVHSDRINGIWLARNKPFPKERLDESFTRLKNWRWGDPAQVSNENDKSGFLQEVDNTINDQIGGVPDLFIIDSITPIFLDRWNSSEDKENFDILGSRDFLGTKLLKFSHEHHIIIIIVAHEKGIFIEKEKKKDYESEDLPFSGCGNRMAFAAKRYIRVVKHTENKVKTRRLFMLEKSPNMPDYSITLNGASFRIGKEGIET